MKVVHVSHDDISYVRFIEPIVNSGHKSGFNVKSIIVNKNNFIKLNKNNYLISNYLSLNPLIFSRALCELIYIICKEKPDIIQVHSTLGSILPIFISFILRVKVRIYHNHGLAFLGYSGLLRNILRSIEKINILFATQIITVSPAMRNILSSITSKDIFCFLPGSSCGLDDKWFQKDKSIKLNNLFLKKRNSKVLLFVGRPSRRKGFFHLLQAFSSINRNKNIILLMIGVSKDDIPNEFKNFDNIIALGIQQDMINFYRISDVLILPSLHEGFGYAILEAAASRNALLVSKIPGPDAIMDKNCGYTFNPYDVSDIKKKIIQIFHDENKLALFKKNAFKKASQFHSSIILGKYINFLKKL
jgi:glycosyltransferase involved in cell wall biosynthesis